MSGGPAWVNGTLAGAVDPRDRGLTLGDGVFDTLVAFGGLPFAGDAHLKRLHAQAREIGIDFDPGRIAAGWRAVIGDATGPTILRTTVTRGSSGRGLWPETLAAPTLIVTGTPWEARLFARPAALITSAVTRNPGSPSARLKATNYLDHILAAREAAARGADDALLLTPSGQVACTTIANVFAFFGDRVVTPPLADAVQPGIMRALVLRTAKRSGWDSEERSLRRGDLFAADAVFLTNSVRFLCPCTSLDGVALPRGGSDRVTALTEAICAQVRESCGVAPRSGPVDEGR